MKQAQEVQLIRKVKGCPAIYKLLDPNHHNSHHLREKWDEVAAAAGVCKATAKSKWKSLYNRMVQEVENQPDSDPEDFESSWEHFKEMRFLIEEIKTREDEGETKAKPSKKAGGNLSKGLEKLKTERQQEEKAPSNAIPIHDENLPCQCIAKIGSDECYLRSLMPHVGKIPQSKKLGCQQQMMSVLAKYTTKDETSSHSIDTDCIVVDCHLNTQGMARGEVLRSSKVTHSGRFDPIYKPENVGRGRGQGRGRVVRPGRPHTLIPLRPAPSTSRQTDSMQPGQPPSRNANPMPPGLPPTQCGPAPARQIIPMQTGPLPSREVKLSQHYAAPTNNPHHYTQPSTSHHYTQSSILHHYTQPSTSHHFVQPSTGQIMYQRPNNQQHYHYTQSPPVQIPNTESLYVPESPLSLSDNWHEPVNMPQYNIPSDLKHDDFHASDATPFAEPSKPILSVRQDLMQKSTDESNMKRE